MTKTSIICDYCGAVIEGSKDRWQITVDSYYEANKAQYDACNKCTKSMLHPKWIQVNLENQPKTTMEMPKHLEATSPALTATMEQLRAIREFLARGTPAPVPVNENITAEPSTVDDAPF